MDLQIHLRQRFLHVLHMHRSRFHQVGPMTAQRTQGADRCLRTERATQQTHRMQVLQPLTVAYVRLASRYMLHVP